MNKENKIVIVGGGIIGSAIAYFLSKTEKNILLIDQFPFHGMQNASSDYSRVFRYEYSKDLFYTNLAVESLKLWKEIEKIASQKIYYKTGVLLLGNQDGDYAMGSYESLKKLNLKVSYLEKEELRKRFPQFTSNYAVVDDNGGILDARLALQTFKDLAKNNGVKFMENIKVSKFENNTLFLEGGEKLLFRELIVASGGWTSKIIENFPIKVTHQDVVFFKPENKSAFVPKNFPPFANLDSGFYGVPSFNIDGVKIANHLPGKGIDIEFIDNEIVPSEFIEKAQEFVKSFIPSLEDSEIIEKKVCFYDMTTEGDFIVDKIKENVFVAAGFSGHGFKFAPLIGKIMADLVKNINTYDINRFKYKRFDSVYIDTLKQNVSF